MPMVCVVLLKLSFFIIFRVFWSSETKWATATFVSKSAISADWKRGLPWKYAHVLCCPSKIEVLFNLLCVLIIRNKMSHTDISVKIFVAGFMESQQPVTHHLLQAHVASPPHYNFQEKQTSSRVIRASAQSRLWVVRMFAIGPTVTRTHTIPPLPLLPTHPKLTYKSDNATDLAPNCLELILSRRRERERLANVSEK